MIKSIGTTLLAGLILWGSHGLPSVSAAEKEKLSEREIKKAQQLAAKRRALDWSDWVAIPVLDDGRIKPLETFANEKVTLITSRSSWTDPVTEVKYEAPLLLFEWITAQDEWAKKPVIRCEYRPLRKLLDVEFIRAEKLELKDDAGKVLEFGPLENEPNHITSIGGTVYVGGKAVADFETTELGDIRVVPTGTDAVPKKVDYDSESRTITLTWATEPSGVVTCEAAYEHVRGKIPEKGKFVAVDDVINWNQWSENRRFQYRSKEIEERFRKIRMTQIQKGRGAKTGKTKSEQDLNEKVQELILHIEAFIVTSDGDNLPVVPNLDPRVLTKQENPDDRREAWITLGSLLEISDLLQTERVARERLEDELRKGELTDSERRQMEAGLESRIAQYRSDVLGSLSDPDPTVYAMLAEDDLELADMLILRGLMQYANTHQEGANLDWQQLVSAHQNLVGQGRFLDSAYPVKHLPQMVKAREQQDKLLPLIEELGPALEETREAYEKARSTEFESAMRTFSKKLRRLGESLDAAREEMTAPDREDGEVSFGRFDAAIWSQYEPLELDEKQMEFSAYPPPGSTDLELHYNQQKPFARAWIFFLISLIIVGFSFVAQAFSESGRAALVVYVLGLCATLGAIAYSTYGFALRIGIAGRPPVTNMYETVIWVGYVVALLAVWFAALPVIWPGLRWAWRLTGLPVRFSRNEVGSVNGIELAHLREDERPRFVSFLWLPMQTLSTLVILVGIVGMVMFLTQSGTSYRIVPLRPPIGSASTTGSMGTWTLGMLMIVLAGYLLPRVALTLAGSGITFIPELLRENREAVKEKLLTRRLFMIPGLFVACLAMMIAHFVGNAAPDILNPNIGSITAVLRNNFWLLIHVLTIVASYGAGALAWGLGNFALLYYLFGKYRREEAPAEPVFAGNNGDQDGAGKDDAVVGRLKKAGGALAPTRIGRTVATGFRSLWARNESTLVRPPKEVATLASFCYAAVALAVLLLAVGTILGGLWADVSWGRFWDWDPKEVWALISLIVYLALLHGRLAGWVGTFGTNVCCVLCFSAIMMSWYGVNFILPQVHGWLNGTGEATEVGLHSYATGAGGLEYVVGALILNVVLIALAGGRYVVETSSQPDAAESPAVEEQEEVTV